MRFDDVGPALDLATLEAWEHEHGCRIPDPYKLFLLRMNGGKPERRVFKFQRKSGSWTSELFHHFAGIGRDYDLGYLLSTFVARDRVPKDLFPIGQVEGSGLLLMGEPGSRFGKVYFWDHEYEAPEGAPPTEDNVYFLADSLEGFLGKLEPLLFAVS